MAWLQVTGVNLFTVGKSLGLEYWCSGIVQSILVNYGITLEEKHWSLVSVPSKGRSLWFHAMQDHWTSTTYKVWQCITQDQQRTGTIYRGWQCIMSVYLQVIIYLKDNTAWVASFICAQHAPSVIRSLPSIPTLQYSLLTSLPSGELHRQISGSPWCRCAFNTITDSHHVLFGWPHTRATFNTGAFLYISKWNLNFLVFNEKSHYHSYLY